MDQQKSPEAVLISYLLYLLEKNLSKDEIHQKIIGQLKKDYVVPEGEGVPPLITEVEKVLQKAQSGR